MTFLSCVELAALSYVERAADREADMQAANEPMFVCERCKRLEPELHKYAGLFVCPACANEPLAVEPVRMTQAEWEALLRSKGVAAAPLTSGCCPVHGSFVLHLNGVRRCNFDCCGWVGFEPLPPEPTCSTGHVMPARALRYQIQRIGLLW